MPCVDTMLSLLPFAVKRNLIGLERPVDTMVARAGEDRIEAGKDDKSSWRWWSTMEISRTFRVAIAFLEGQRLSNRYMGRQIHYFKHEIRFIREQRF